MSSRSRVARGVVKPALTLAVGVFAVLACGQDRPPDEGGAPAEAADVLVVDQEVLPEAGGGAASDMVTPQTQAALDQGPAFLAPNHSPNGAFGVNRYHGNVAVTALCGLAFMSAGHQPGRGKYGPVVSKAIEYVLNQEQPNVDGRPTPGFLFYKALIKQHGAMYEHGFGT